jgi:FAD/FMN-containing dehydrogenase
MGNETSTLAATSRSPISFVALEKGVRGEILRPDDAGYDAARRVWNASIDRHPAVIVRCAGAADVVGALDFARASGLPVAVRGGGHNVAGNAVCDGGIVVDLSAMKGIRVDPERRIALAQPGLTWREFDHETQAFGLATPGGLISGTGIAGFTLGGGLGWLSRKHGTASDNLLSADVVTADGRLLSVDSANHADLFWAIRGGGGNFGVVTGFKYRLHPVGPWVLGGVVFYPGDAAGDVLRFLRDVLAPFPDELVVAAVLRLAPPAPFLPSHVHGRPVIALGLCWSGSIDEGEAKLRPLREFRRPLADLLQPRPYTELQRISDAAWGPGFHNYWKAEYLRGLTDDAIDVIVNHASAITSPLSDVKVIPGGGAVARADEQASAFAHRRAPFVLNINSRWGDRGEAERHIDWTRAFWEAMRPFSADGVYVNFLGDEGEERVRAAYGPVIYQRLAEVKAKYDPTNFFRFNHNIRPRLRED